MKRLTYRWRRPQPVDDMQNSVVAALRRFGAEFLESESFKHALTKGEERERPIREFFSAHLPQLFSIDSGEVVDIRGKKSPQLDIIITDGMRNVPLHRGKSVIMPAEALLCSIEVKSKLTKEDIKSALMAAKKLRALRPFKMSLATPRQRGAPADSHCRYFHTVFAYGTDVSEGDWARREYSRLLEVCAESNIPTTVIDRIYVANRGMINVPNGSGISEELSSGRAFLQYYMHTLNFLVRENARRDATPYLEYAGKMTGGWHSLRPKKERRPAQLASSGQA